MGAMMQKACPNCRRLAPISALKCNECGTRLTSALKIVRDNIEPPPTPLVQKETPEGSWTCDSCQFAQNREDDLVCSLCERERQPVRSDGGPPQSTEPTKSYKLRFSFGDVDFTREITVGRNPAFCSFAKELTAYNQVSRKHAIIEVGVTDFVITDLESTNGTFLDGVRIAPKTPTTFKAGAELMFSNSLKAVVRE